LPLAEIYGGVAELLGKVQRSRNRAPDALLNIFIEEQLVKWSRESFDAQGGVGVSLELENVLLHILAEG